MSEIDWKARAEAAEAAVAVLREALIRRHHGPRLVGDAEYADAALTSTAEAAAARDARIRAEGRREGIEGAIRRVEMQPLVADDGGVVNVVLLNLRAMLAGEDGR